MPDISSDWAGIESKVQSLGTYKEVSEAQKNLTSKAGNSLSNSLNSSATQLNKIKEQQKRFQRSTPTSMDQLVNLIGTTKGNSSSTFKYLRKKLLDTLVKIEPKIVQIIIDETIKALGCSQEQTYNGIKLPSNNQIGYIELLDSSKGIYIPVSSVDFMGNLKIAPDTDLGKLYYEEFDPNTKSGFFVPYGGPLKFPLNKMLNFRMDSNNVNRTYSREFNNFYNGLSEQNLFDISYTTTNELGVSGDYFRVFLLDRNGSDSNASNNIANKVGEFLSDYYDTIKIVDPVTIGAAVLNYSSNFVSIRKNLTYGEAVEENKFDRLIVRILGLCQDSRREIDVSGIAKIPELDGVDDSFFEFNEVDLRLIDERINNIQKGIVQFESCGDVNLPVNTDTLFEEIVKFRDSVSGNTPQQNVKKIENLIDTFIDNPLWKPLIPKGADVGIDINKNIIKDLPKAVASGILTPKVLLPILVMISAIEQSATNTINNVIQPINTLIQSANTILQSGTTIGQQVNNIINGGVDFIKKFKTFCINVITRINAEFLKVLFDVLKKDILNLINVIITDASKSAATKKYTIILRLVQLATIVVNFIRDYRKCKSLIDDILNLLRLINSTFNITNRIPLPLLFLTQGLPGFSPERAQLNVLQELQKMGMPTGAMPDGSPNMMNQFMGGILKGSDKEESENGTIDATVVVPPITGGVLTVYGKKR